MKNFNKTLIYLLSIFTLASCGFNNLSHIEDTNGEEDTSLCSLTEEDLLDKHTHSLFNMSSTTTKNNKTTFKCNIFSGVSDITSYTINEATSFTVTSLIESGNGDFFIYQDGKRIQTIGFPYNGTILVNSVIGKIHFRIAGESAKMNITIIKN
ncbi:MAG: hypothetical protein ACI311_06600 [Bacilli bacterium]